jgi:hypothetical protein
MAYRVPIATRNGLNRRTCKLGNFTLPLRAKTHCSRTTIDPEVAARFVSPGKATVLWIRQNACFYGLCIQSRACIVAAPEQKRQSVSASH